ncbi:MAG: flippase-like domain-containing protein [Myxococcales bacterium]|nr:flippase-like domain-containing protein [Myxococcales bacterium]
MTSGVRRFSRWPLLLLPWLGLIVAVVLLMSSVDLAAAGRHMLAADGAMLGGALLCLPFTVLIAGIKVQRIFALADVPLSLRRVCSAVLAAASLNMFVPGRGGDLLKAVFLMDDRRLLPKTIGLVLVERALDVGALGMWALTAGAFFGYRQAALLGGATVAVTLLGMVALGASLRLPLLGRKAVLVREALGALRRAPLGLAVCGFLAAVTWATNLLTLWLCLGCVGAHATMVDVVAAGPIAILAGALPVSVSGIGTRDVVLVAMLVSRELDAERVAAGALLYTLTQSVGLPLVGLFALGRQSLAAYRRLAVAPAPEGHMSVGVSPVSPTRDI